MKSQENSCSYLKTYLSDSWKHSQLEKLNERKETEKKHSLAEKSQLSNFQEKIRCPVSSFEFLEQFMIGSFR